MDQDTVMEKSSVVSSISMRLFLLGGLMVHRELELPPNSATIRSSDW